jgi:hypothetical protein
MRLIHRQRSHRPRALRVPISQEEIAADLHYPATRRDLAKSAGAQDRGARR